MSELEPECREGAGGDRLPRPLPTRSLPERAAAWMSWVGPGRLLGTVVVAAAVVAGAYWLTRAPTPPTEQQLPFTAGTAPTTTVHDVPEPAAAGNFDIEKRRLGGVDEVLVGHRQTGLSND